MTSAWGHYRPVADKHIAPAGMLGLAPAADVLRLPKLPLTGTYRTVRKHADRTLAEFRPFVSAYLLVIGLLILLKAVRLSPTQEDAQVSYAAPLGLIGGFLDAVGGGGWGPMVTSTLIGSGHAPRRVIGSVNAAEFFVTIAVATTFFIELGASHIEHIVALVIGGCAAAPFGAFVVRRVNQHALMALVGVLVSLVSLFQLVKALG